MRTWQAMLLNVAAVSDGAQMCVNTSFTIEGEVRLRPAIERKFSLSSSLGMANYGAPNGNQYALFVSATGDLTADVAP